jgi:hypothetical protein
LFISVIIAVHLNLDKGPARAYRLISVNEIVYSNLRFPLEEET